MKLVTGAVAFDLLGTPYQFTTKVFYDSVFNKETGSISGNLFIRGGGDPGFNAQRLWLFVQHLIHQGVRKIGKDLILDDSFFDIKTQGPGFGEDGSSRAYEAPTAALSANFNTIAIHVAPGKIIGDPILITPFPRVKGVKIVSTAKTIASTKTSGLKITTEKLDGKTAVFVYGSMRLNEKPRYRYRKVWSTWENFGWMLQALFEECGIEFNGTVRHEVTPDSIMSKKPFYTFPSQPLPVFIFNMFKYSSNFAAEMVFKTVATENDTVPGSWESGSRQILSWWKNKNISPFSIKDSTFTFPVISNGSGMGGKNRVSPAHIVSLLEYVNKNKKYSTEFLYALSVAGIDGTLKSRFTKSHLIGMVRGKTGTLNSRGVSNLAGYIVMPEKTYMFAILVTNKKLSQMSHWTLQQKILEVVAPLPVTSKIKKAENKDSDSQLSIQK